MNSHLYTTTMSFIKSFRGIRPKCSAAPFLSRGFYVGAHKAAERKKNYTGASASHTVLIQLRRSKGRRGTQGHAGECLLYISLPLSLSHFSPTIKSLGGATDVTASPNDSPGHSQSSRNTMPRFTATRRRTYTYVAIYLRAPSIPLYRNQFLRARRAKLKPTCRISLASYFAC